MTSGSDEAPDPRAELQEHAEQMAQELMRTADLAGKLGWTQFDFEIDLHDPFLDDLEGLLAGGQASKETLSALLGHSLDRHVTPAVRLKILKAVEGRIANEVRIDVRQQGMTVMRALQHLSMPLASIGLIWQLYPGYMVHRVQERRKISAGEEAERTSEESALIDALSSGKGDPAALGNLGTRAMGIIERLLWEFVEKAPPDLEIAKKIVGAAASHPGRRMARALMAVLYSDQREALGDATRASFAAMPVETREQIHHHLLVRDPDPAVRAALYAVAAAIGDKRLSPFMVEDALGAGPWSVPGEGPAHARSILPSLVTLKDRRSVPMMLHVMSARPPKADVKNEVLEAFKAGPLGTEFEEGRQRIEEGKPVVVPRGMSQEEFLHKYGTFPRKMEQAKMQVEIKRVTGLWEQCYHEDYGWKRPQDVLSTVGTREKELLKKLSKEVQEQIGRLAGHPQVAALESEFKTTWMTTPQNDVSGRIPLAIILDERASAGHDPAENKQEREHEAAELYAMACRAQEAKMPDEARRFASAVLQIVSDHPFAKDFLARVEKAEGIPGIDSAGSASSGDGPRIIMP